MSYSYELVVILDSSVSDERQKKILEDVKKLITSATGKTESEKLWGKKKFSYPIKRVKDGFYYLFNITLEGKETAQLSNELKLNEGILRYLLIRR